MPERDEIRGLVDRLATAEDEGMVQNRLQTIESRVARNPDLLVPLFVDVALDLLLDQECPRITSLCRPVLETLEKVACRHNQRPLLVARGLERVVDFARQDSDWAGYLLATVERVVGGSPDSRLAAALLQHGLLKFPLLAPLSPGPTFQLLRMLREAARGDDARTTTVFNAGLAHAERVASHDRAIALDYLTLLADIAQGKREHFSEDGPVHYGPRGSMLCDVFMVIAAVRPAGHVVVFFREPLENSSVYAPGYDRGIHLAEFMQGVRSWEGAVYLPPHVPLVRCAAAEIQGIQEGRINVPRLRGVCAPATL